MSRTGSISISWAMSIISPITAAGTDCLLTVIEAWITDRIHGFTPNPEMATLSRSVARTAAPKSTPGGT